MRTASKRVSTDYAIEVADKEYRRGRQEAIEECARVAEEYGWESKGVKITPSTSYEIAAAIRALKDKPH